jgi:hypothetical protein
VCASCTGHGDEYVLTAPDARTRDDWVNAIDASIRRTKQANNNRLRLGAAANSSNAALERAGYVCARARALARA